MSQTATLTSANNGAINFNSTLDAAANGVEGLTAATNGTTQFSGIVGAPGKNLSFLTVANPAGKTNINTTAINTTGDQNYDATTLSQTATLTSANIGAINFNSTLDAAANGAQGLTSTTGGAATFNDKVGNNNQLAFLTSNGATSLNGASVQTTGAQNYNGNTTLVVDNTLTGSAVNFNGKVDGAKNLTVDAANVGINGAVGGLTALTSLTSNGATSLDAGSIQTAGAQNYNGATTLVVDNALTGVAVNFNGTVDGAKNLTVTAANVGINGAVGGQTALTSLTSNGVTSLNGGSVQTSAAQNYNGATMLAVDNTLTGGSVNFNGKVDGAKNLTVTAANVGINGAVGGQTALTSLTSNGATSLDAGSIQTAGAQNYNGATTLVVDNALTGVAVNFNGTVDGAKNLTVTAANVGINGAVGGQTALISLTSNGAASLNGVSIQTSGAQNYNGATTLVVDNTLTGGAVNFNGTVDGAKNLTVTAANVGINGAVGGQTALASLTSNGATSLNGGSVQTSGAQNYNGATTLVVDNTLTGSAVNFNGKVDGANNLTVTAANIGINGAVGGQTALASLTSNGATSLNGGSVQTSGAQNYNGAATLAVDNSLTGGAVNFNGSVDGANNLTVNAANIAFNGVVGGQTALTSLTSNGATGLYGGGVNTNGAQTYDQSVSLGAATTLNSGGGAVTFNATVDGANALTINAGAGNIYFYKMVGGLTPLTSLGITAGAGTTDINGGGVNTNGPQSYGQKVILSADALLASHGGDITFWDTVNGVAAYKQSLTADSGVGGNITFWGNIGDVFPLLSLTLLGTGLKSINGTMNVGSLTTQGSLDYLTDLFLTSDLTLSVIDGNVTFHKRVNGPFALSVTAQSLQPNFGDIDFLGTVGDLAPLASLTLKGSGTTHVNGGLVATSGSQSYGEALSLGLGQDTTLTSSLGGVSFLNTVNGAQALTVNTPNGVIDINGGVVNTAGDQIYNGAAALSADAALTSSAGNIDFATTLDGNFGLTTNSSLNTTFGGAVNIGSLGATASNINLNNGAVTTAQDQVYNGAVVLTPAASLTSTGGNIALNGIVTGANQLTTNSALNTTFGGAVNVGSLDVTAKTINLTNGSVTTAQDQIYKGAVALTPAAGLTSTNGNISLNGSVTGANQLTTNSRIDTTFNGAVSVGSLDATAGGNINLNAGTIATNADQTYHTAVALTGSNGLTSAAGNIDFASTIGGANALTTNSASDTTFGGAVNIGSLGATAAGKINLTNGSVTTAQDQSYSGAVALTPDATLTSQFGNIALNGSVNGGNKLTTNSGLGTTFGGAVSVGSLDATAAGGLINLNAGSIGTTGGQIYRGHVQLLADNALTAGGAISFAGAVTGNGKLTTNSALDTTFGGAVSIVSLDATAGGNINLNAGAIGTTGDQNYRTAVALTGNNGLSSASGNIDFAAAVSGGFSLFTNSNQNTIFGGAVNAGSLNATANGTIYLNNGVVTTAMEQNYTGTVALTPDATLTSQNWFIALNGPVNGSNKLTTNSFVNTTFGGAVSVGSLDATSAFGNINLNAGTIRTTGDQAYHSGVDLLGDNALTAGGAIGFAGAVNGNSKLTTNSTLDTTFGGAVNIGSLDATANTVNLNNGSVTTAQDQSYSGAVALTPDATLTSQFGNIALNGSVNGGNKLTTNSGLGTTFGGAVSVGSLDATAAGGLINLNAGSIGTTGGQIYRGHVQLLADNALTAGGAISFAGAVTGNGKLTTNSALDTTFGGAVSIVSLDATAGGNINLNAGAIGTTGDQNYRTAVALTGNNGLSSASGNIDFAAAVSGGFSLFTNSNQNTIFGGAVNAGSLNATANGTIYLNNGVVTTAMEQNYTGTVALTPDATLTSQNWFIALNGPVNGSNKLTTNSFVNTTFGGAVSVGSLDATSAFGNINLNAGTIRTTGDQAYHSGVDLLGDNALTAGGAIGFAGAVNGNSKLTTNSTLDTTFGGAVNIGSLDATAGGNINLNARTIGTNGDQNYNTAVVLTANSGLTSAAGNIAFAGTLGGANSLTTNSALDTTFDGTVNIFALGATAGGKINLNNGVVTTAQDQTYNGAVALLPAASLTSTNGNIALNGSVTGANDLTTNSNAGTTFGGAVNVGSLDATAGGKISLNAGTIVTTGDQSYHSAVIIGANDALVSSAGGVTFDKSIDGLQAGLQSLAIDAQNDITLKDAVGSVTPLRSLTLNGAGGAGAILLNGGVVDTTSGQTYGQGVVLGANTTLNNNDAATAVTFDKTLGGQHDLTINAGAGDINFLGAVGDAAGLTSLTSLALTGTGTTDINGGFIYTSGAQTYGEKIVLSANAWLGTDGNLGSDVTFSKTVDGTVIGKQGLTVDGGAQGAITFYDNVGGIIPLSYLTLLGNGVHTLYGSVGTTGNQDYLNDLFLFNDLTLISNNGNVTFHKRVDGGHILTVNAGTGDISFLGLVGSLTPLSELILSGTGITHLNGGAVTTTGLQSYGEAVALGANTTLTSKAGNVSFAQAVDGAQSLTINAINADFFGAVGAASPLASLTVNGSGTTDINGGAVSTVGDQAYNEASVLSADAALTSAAGNIAFASTLGGGAYGLTTKSSADTTFGGAVSVNSLDATAGGKINLNGGSVATAGDQTYRSAVLQGTDNSLTAKNITFANTLGGIHALTTNSAADTTFNGAVNIGSLDATAGGNINLNAGSIATTGIQNYRSTVLQGSDNSLTAQNITFAKTIGGIHALTTNSSVDVTFNGAVNIGSLDATAGGKINLNGGSVATAGAQAYHSAVVLGADASLTGSALALAGISGVHSLNTNSTEDTTFGGAANVAALDATAGGNINLIGGSVATTGDQNYRSGVLLGGDDSLTSSAGNIAFANTIGGAHGLTTNSALDTTFAGAVDVGSLDATAGGTINLNGGAVTTTGKQTYRSAVSYGADTVLASNGGNVTFNGAVTGVHDLTVDASNANPLTASGNIEWNALISAVNLKLFGNDLVMRGDVSASGANGVLMSASHSFQNLGTDKILLPGTGRWLIYSIDPKLDTDGGLTGSVQWSTTYHPGVSPSFAGNGFLYADAAPAPAPVIINIGEINNGDNVGSGGSATGVYDGSISQAGSDGSTASNWSATPSDIFSWDLGTLRDAVASPDEDGYGRKKKNKAKTKSPWFKEP